MGHAALRPACGKSIRAHVMQTKNCLKLIGFSGEPDRIRTCDPLIKSQLLYQLSYGPTLDVAFKEGRGGRQGLLRMFFKQNSRHRFWHRPEPIISVAAHSAFAALCLERAVTACTFRKLLIGDRLLQSVPPLRAKLPPRHPKMHGHRLRRGRADEALVISGPAIDAGGHPARCLQDVRASGHRNCKVSHWEGNGSLIRMKLCQARRCLRGAIGVRRSPCRCCQKGRSLTTSGSRLCFRNWYEYRSRKWSG